MTEGKAIKSSGCPLCGANDAGFYFSERGYDLLGCQVCQLFYISPYPYNSEEIHNTVEDYSYQKLKVVSPQNHYASSIPYFKRYFPLIEDQLENIRTFLDVGCGTGRLLELMKTKPGIESVGIELNSQRAEFSAKKTGCDIHQIPVEKFSWQGKGFDLIAMINVLSHISSFDDLFNSLRSLLTERGKLILKVGEVTNSVKKNAIIDWGLPDHLHFLGMETLDFICEKYGFKILKHQRIPYATDLFSLQQWKTPGRSRVRNIIKRVVVTIPFALFILKKMYQLRFKDAVFSSFIVLGLSEKKPEKIVNDIQE